MKYLINANLTNIEVETTIISAGNYKEAQTKADEKYGVGASLDLIGLDDGLFFARSSNEKWTQY